MPSETVWGVVLAAGQGRRFGGHKLLAPFRGAPLVTHGFKAAADSVASGLLGGAVAVCAAGDDEVESLARAAGLHTVEHAGATMALSLQIGLSWLASRPAPPDGALIMLGDQPMVRPEHVSAVLASAAESTAPICRPRYLATPDSPGHPVLLRRSAWSAMAAVDGDVGLREVIAAGGIELHLCNLPGSCPDIDTPDDLIALEATR